jgi:hypothetical protein
VRTSLLRVRDELDHVEDSLNDRPLEIVSSLVAKNAGKEVEHDRLLRRELEAKSTNGADDDDLELVRNLRHEGRDLLHETVDGRLVSSLEEGRDGESRDATVVVVDELLHVEVANLDSVGVGLRELGESTDGGELESRFRRREEKLEDCRRGGVSRGVRREENEKADRQ